ncbi:DUF1763-domain-containing protein [Xylariaceae sp. FL0016]|nr:DUF1763-domain-containing protein [Xylariaceae sp. FL0016]
MAADLEVIHAYRHLYRGLLHAVQFSKPARYVAREKLRTAFREKGAKFDIRGVARTIRFLDAATRERGLEHSVLKNILTMSYFRDYYKRMDWKRIHGDQANPRRMTEFEQHMQNIAYKHYDMTIAMLNKSVGLCLR